MEEKRSIGNGKNAALLVTVFFAVLLFVITYKISIGLPCDYPVHLDVAEGMGAKLFLKELFLSGYPLWHGITKFISVFFAIPVTYAGGAASGIANVLTYIIVYHALCQFFVNKMSPYIASAASFMLLILGPLHAEWFNNGGIYVGIGTINIWHNPSNPAVRPFALAAFLVFGCIYSRYAKQCSGLNTCSEYAKVNVYTIKERILFPLLLFLSVAAKPSFLQFFIPALGIFLLIEIIRTKGRMFWFAFKIAVAFVPAVLKMFAQMMYNFGTEEGGVAFGWLKVWTHYSESIPYSLFLFMAFPMFIVLTNLKWFIKNAEGRLSVIGFGVAVLEYCVLYEKGERILHGNFAWGMYIAAFLLWFVAMKVFLEHVFVKDRDSVGSRACTIIGSMLFILHIIVGIEYILCFLMDSSFSR